MITYNDIYEARQHLRFRSLDFPTKLAKFDNASIINLNHFSLQSK
ncbi:Uncharacterised protein [uncultured archaeon]|nr:Uncharacterised protein [uncultured archaeon]